MLFGLAVRGESVEPPAPHPEPFDGLRAHGGVLGLVLLLLLTACGTDHPKLPRLSQDAVVLAFGDSLTYGTGAAEKDSYPAVLQSLILRTVVRAGVPGEVTADGLVRLSDALAEHTPKLLILCHGGNDLLRNLGEQQAAANIRAMITLARTQGVNVVLVGVPKAGLLLSSAEFYQKIAQEFAIPYEAAALSDILASRALKSDTVHPNAQGYRKLAEALASLLQESGAI